MKVIAWYLPQFHETPENNEWWGEGFTEWTNVKKGVQLYPDQYQPRVPLNNNYYNLLDKKVLEWQVELAKKHGIYGFCIGGMLNRYFSPEITFYNIIFP